MGLALTDEHVELERVVDAFLERQGGRAPARHRLEGDAEPPGLWAAMAELGWLGLHVPEELGGSGFGVPELCVVAERLGRACVPGPFVPTAALAGALVAAGARDELIGELAAGRRRAGLGLDGDADVRDGRASGRWGAVLGAADADVLGLVAGDDLLVVDAGDPGVVRGGRTGHDPGLAPDAVTLTDAAVRVVAGAAGAATGLAQLLAAADAAGGAAACRELSVTYAGEREAFGRPIGGFQVIKHACADQLVREQLAVAAVWDAARSADGCSVAPPAAAVAALVGVDALRQNAKATIQVHGGIGFTWEHDAHLWLRRGTVWQALLPARHLVDEVLAAGAGGRATFTFPPEADRHFEEARAFRERWLAAPAPDRPAMLVDEGYLYPHWPAPWGRGAGVLEQLAVEQVFAGDPRHEHLGTPAWTLPIVLPTLMQHGTPEQQERWIRPTMLGRVRWCQLFSEPGAGSDLASLTTRAERADGGWLVTGQKVWTSSAGEADVGFALVRTDRDAPRHAGITAMVIDVRAPGVTIRPLRQIMGDAHFNEVFFDEVFVPDADVVGPVNGGWSVAVTTLGNERVSLGDADTTAAASWALLLDRAPSADAAARAAIARLLAEQRAVDAINLRIATRAVIGADPGVEGNLTKLVTTGIGQRVTELALELLGPEGAYGDEAAPTVWYEAFRSRAMSIAGGTSEILRNIIGERVLALPRERR